MKIFGIILTLFVSATSFADQCQVLTDFQKEGAKALIEHSIEKGRGIVSLCQNCGETQAKFVRATGAIKALKFDPSIVAHSWTLEMENSDQIIDAAYIYVYTNVLSTNNNFKWFNLAELVGCTYSGSSRYLTEINHNGVHSREFHNGTRNN
jgi:hypothetical protein